MATTFEAGTAYGYGIAKGVLTQSSLLGLDDPLLNITFNCLGRDRNGDPNQGVAYAYAIADGAMPFVHFEATATAYGIATATPIWGSVYKATATAYALAYGDILLEGLRRNFVKWPKIGTMDFTIGRSNVAGEMPLDWQGWIYGIKKLKDKVVAYGKGGVSLLIPAGVKYGLNTIYRIGLKSKQAVAGDDNTHYFIDNKGQLYSLGESLQKLDYSECLSAMSSPVMSYDAENELVYICDGTLGYVYSPRDKSLGSGPINVTGISSQGGTLYVAAPATILMPDFEICTDIYDLGTRKLKTVFSLEYGVDVEATLQAKIDYRFDKAVAFSQTSWHDVDEKGFANITCNGREFRFRTRLTSYEWITLDYINVNGEVLEH